MSSASRVLGAVRPESCRAPRLKGPAAALSFRGPATALPGGPIPEIPGEISEIRDPKSHPIKAGRVATTTAGGAGLIQKKPGCLSLRRLSWRSPQRKSAMKKAGFLGVPASTDGCEKGWQRRGAGGGGEPSNAAGAARRGTCGDLRAPAGVS